MLLLDYLAEKLLCFSRIPLCPAEIGEVAQGIGKDFGFDRALGQRLPHPRNGLPEYPLRSREVSLPEQERGPRGERIHGLRVVLSIESFLKGNKRLQVFLHQLVFSLVAVTLAENALEFRSALRLARELFARESLRRFAEY